MGGKGDGDLANCFGLRSFKAIGEACKTAFAGGRVPYREGEDDREKGDTN